MSVKSETINLLTELSIKPSEKLGQHFLVDEEAVSLVKTRTISQANVVEVGAGTGILTEQIAAKAGSVFAVEVDPRFEPALFKVSEQFINVKFQIGDILKIRLHTLLKLDDMNQLISNLPFHITEPFLLMCLGLGLESLVLILGDNTANLIKCKDTSESYSRLSLLTQTFFDYIELAHLPKSYFYPQPRTDSQLLELIPKSAQEIGNHLESAIYYHLFTTRSRHQPVANSLRLALGEYLQKSEGKLLSKRDGWQRDRAKSRREAKLLLRNFKKGALSESPEENCGNQPTSHQDRTFELIVKAINDPEILQKHFFDLDNGELRKLVFGIKSVLTN